MVDIKEFARQRKELAKRILAPIADERPDLQISALAFSLIAVVGFNYGKELEKEIVPLLNAVTDKIQAALNARIKPEEQS